MKFHDVFTRRNASTVMHEGEVVIDGKWTKLDEETCTKQVRLTPGTSAGSICRRFIASGKRRQQDRNLRGNTCALPDRTRPSRVQQELNGQDHLGEHKRLAEKCRGSGFQGLHVLRGIGRASCRERVSFLV